MHFIADLHIHSRFSRATSKQLTPRHLAAWAGCKGINVLGTGDFTHPGWRAELREQLTLDAASGLYRLAVPPEAPVFPVSGSAEGQGPSEQRGPLFCLQAEISSIYKRGGKVRKVHNLIYVPTLDDAERLSLRLELVGNLHSDGRPILGLDSRDLLEITLEAVPDAVMIPAHVWTPWFALFGSKSGFDRLEDCFGDLSAHIFALETGLSSDPAMNRRISRLDGYALISNSDAHSGANLGREANLFAGKPSYAGMFAALRASARRVPQDDLDCRFLGTLEFYPEEGKYHLDGHRACNVVLEPEESRALGNICPVCRKPLTVGVLHRVLELADRSAPPKLLLEPEVRPLIPLPELLGEMLGVGPGSVKVQARYARLLEELGPELDILCRLPTAQLRTAWEPLGEAVERMRRGQVIRRGGYDGEYGVVRVFTPEEARELHGGRIRALPGLTGFAGLAGLAGADGHGALTAAAVPAKALRGKGATKLDATKLDYVSVTPHEAAGPERTTGTNAETGAAAESTPPPAFSPEQGAALRAGPGPVLVAAGPGAGKTRVLMGRLQYLLEQGQDPAGILAVTFTRRAAGELRERLAQAVPEARRAGLVCDTLHGLAWAALRRERPQILLLSEDAAFSLFRTASPQFSMREARASWAALSLARERGAFLPAADAKRGNTGHAAQPGQGGDQPGQPDQVDQGVDQALRDAAGRYAALKKSRAASCAPTAGLPTTATTTGSTAAHCPEYVDYADLMDFLHGWARPDRFRHVLVDEIQDLSPVQAAALRALLPEDGQGFFGIGDPDQAVYGFRGAQGLDESTLVAWWPQLHVHRLGQSFRAGQGILDMAHGLLQKRGRCGALRAARALPVELRLFAAPDERAENRALCGRVQRLLGGGSHTLLDQARLREDQSELDAALAPGDIAVLVRLKAQIPPLRTALEQAGIPCAAPAEEDISQDPACARLLALPAAAYGIAEMFPVPEGFELADGAGLCAAGSPFPPPQELAARLAEQPWAGPLFCASPQWRQICRLWRECGSWESLLHRLVWLHEAELVKAKAEHVRILTLHASKGLEFQAVFLPGLESGLVPLRRELLFGEQAVGAGQAESTEREEIRALEEERRLLYVGLTRAARALFVSYSARRTLYGKTLCLAPSPFLSDIRNFCRQRTLKPQKRTAVEHLSLF